MDVYVLKSAQGAADKHSFCLYKTIKTISVLFYERILGYKILNYIKNKTKKHILCTSISKPLFACVCCNAADVYLISISFLFTRIAYLVWVDIFYGASKY